MHSVPFIVATFAVQLVFAQQLELITEVDQLIESLPKCGQTCIQQVPQYSTPFNLDSFQHVCQTAPQDMAAFLSCIKTACTEGEDIQTDVLMGTYVATEVIMACNELFNDKVSEDAKWTSVNAASIPEKELNAVVASISPVVASAISSTAILTTSSKPQNASAIPTKASLVPTSLIPS
ncbi:UNVERIFIED_CONTAM: hypothetical protein HDU68_003268, partial [Siphonaria sp. JEL0065]